MLPTIFNDNHELIGTLTPLAQTNAQTNAQFLGDEWQNRWQGDHMMEIQIFTEFESAHPEWQFVWDEINHIVDPKDDQDVSTVSSKIPLLQPAQYFANFLFGTKPKRPFTPMIEKLVLTESDTVLRLPLRPRPAHPKRLQPRRRQHARQRAQRQNLRLFSQRQPHKHKLGGRLPLRSRWPAG